MPAYDFSNLELTDKEVKRIKDLFNTFLSDRVPEATFERPKDVELKTEQAKIPDYSVKTSNSADTAFNLSWVDENTNSIFVTNHE